MKKFIFYVDYIEINKSTLKADKLGEISLSATASTYEEGRLKALEYAQSIARCYESNNETAFFFRISETNKTTSQGVIF